MKSTNQDMVLWQQRINERAASGLSVSEWCKINDIKKNRYYYWRNKINKTQVPNDTIEFVEVNSIISEEHEDKRIQDNSADFQVFFRSIQVTVSSNFNHNSLAELMKVLQQL